MNDLALRGCRPEPLGSYLKALAVLRLVGEQKDAEARGYWRDDTFHLVSTLDEEALVEFFAKEYAPTPIVGPWNGGSGFYEGDDTSALEYLSIRPLRCRLSTLVQSIDEVVRAPMFPKRGLTIRELIDETTRAVGTRDGKQRDDILAITERIRQLTANRDDLLEFDPDASQKGELQRQAKKLLTLYKKLFRSDFDLAVYLRASLPDAALGFLDGAIGFRVEELAKLGVAFGGNEGRNNYTKTFLDCVRWLVQAPPATASQLIRNGIFGSAALAFVDGPMGELFPGSAGGANQGPEFETKDTPRNPFDFLMAMEGTISLAGSPSKLLAGRAFPTSPFMVAAGAGDAAATADASPKNREFWAPLWARPAAHDEVAALLSEGRAMAGQRPARKARDMLSAMATLGVDRAISGFERFTILEHRGQGYFVARPSGRFDALELRGTGLVADVVALIAEHDRQALMKWRKLDRVPARLRSLAHRCEAELFAYAERSAPDRASRVMSACGRLEQGLAVITTSRRGPLSGLSPAWLGACSDTLELRVAAALASIRGEGDVGPLRANLVPVEPCKPYRFASGAGQVAWEGSSLAARLGSVLRRRLIDAERLRCERLPLAGAIALSVEDVAAFLEGRTDDRLLEELLFAFTWLDWRKTEGFAELRTRWSRPIERAALPPHYALLKSVLEPSATFHEPRVVPLLLAREVGRAVERASVRLRVNGFVPADFSPTARRMPPLANPSVDPIRLAASLLIPIRQPERLLARITHRSAVERNTP